MRILVTRPEADGAAIARRLEALGHQPLLAPLLTVHLLPHPPLELRGVQAVLATSANGVRAFAENQPVRDLPLFTVGPQSAAAARDLNFTHVRSAGGDAAALADMAAESLQPDAGPLLHVAAEEADSGLADRLAAEGFHLRRENLYRVEVARHLPDDAAQALRQGVVDAALFFSPRSAGIFAQCLARDQLPVGKLIAICISANTAAALEGLAFAQTRIAAMPDQDGVLACL
jgi:uroporphyrinogen-III synthase